MTPYFIKNGLFNKKALTYCLTLCLSILFSVLLSLFCEKSFAAGSLNERHYKILQAIHKQIEANQLLRAKQQLDKFLSVKHDAYTQALFFQTAAHIAIEQEQYNRAISYLEKADSLDTLPDYVSQNIKYNLAQLYAQNNDLDKSLIMLERWLKGNNKVTSEQHIFAATLYGEKKKYNSAVVHVKKAINLAPQSSVKNKAWYQLLISFYLEQKKYSKAIRVYQLLIKNYPGDKTFWKQLSALYLQKNKPQQALAVMELAEKQGMLSNEQELLRLVNLYLYANIPVAAAQLLQTKLDSSAIKPTLKNREKLADSWIMAQEYTRAIDVLKKLAQLNKNDGKYSFQSGRLLMEQGKWQDAYEQFSQAEHKKRVAQGENYLLQGISAYYAKMPLKAEIAFNKAAKFKKQEKKSSLWLEQLN
jgi:tetratricopeptide (TPR) repeat protein